MDPKRANNIMISFKRLRVDASRVAAALQLCDFGFLTDDVVAILAKIVPSDEVSGTQRCCSDFPPLFIF